MKRTVIGVLAHVDAGKTTLSEALLYCAGDIRRLGRVDHGDAFLDTFALERQRGITIFSKQALLTLPGLSATLLDTPGHVDFSAEMERTLAVLDCAVLVVSATEPVQSHTRTVWKLLRQRHIPTFLFINKMDLPGADRAQSLAQLCQALGEGLVDYAADSETLALCDETLLEEFLRIGSLREASLATAVARCRLFPCFFGAALRLDGVEEFLRALAALAPAAADAGTFAARVFKISRDEQGTRLTHMKLTGGTLRVRSTLAFPEGEEKVTQLRIYSGARYRAADEAAAGEVVAVAGLSRTWPGQGLGAQRDSQRAALEPPLIYRVLLPQGCDAHKALSQFRQLEEEEPQLHVDWEERLGELRVRLMGPVQLEILRQLLLDRHALAVEFGEGSILYRETIENAVEGVGHYEPLRHYAEVHLLLEPGARGSGLHFASDCSEDELDRSWQRLILTHLAEKQQPGVLTGAPITDMTITLLSGRAHPKHTEGGDFRQATYRAVRQGLMQAQSVLLEPWYDFCLELPAAQLGRAMTDLQRLGARLAPPENAGELSVLRGSASVAALRHYPQELTAYTHGLGHISLSLRGYEPCGEQAAVVAAAGYDAAADTENPPHSIFCSHGAGVTVPWDEVPAHMHLPSALPAAPAEAEPPERAARRYCEMVATDKELMAIFQRTYGPLKPAPAAAAARPPLPPRPYRAAAPAAGPEYLLVDGYNILFAWDELRALANKSLDTARSRLLDILRNYQGFRQCRVILVFDAYKVPGNPGSVERYGDVSVVYTREAETADMYIEKATRELGSQHRVRVATSDALEQIIILGHGALRVSAREFEQEVRQAEQAIRAYLQKETR